MDWKRLSAVALVAFLLGGFVIWANHGRITDYLRAHYPELATRLAGPEMAEIDTQASYGQVLVFLLEHFPEIGLRLTDVPTAATGGSGHSDDSADDAGGSWNGESGGISEPYIEPMVVESGEIYDVQRIFFGTDRAVEGDTEAGPVFGHDRANALTLGYTDITIPKTAHKIGDVELPDSFTLFKVTLWEEAEDPARHFTVYETSVLSEDDFLSMAAESAAAAETYAATAFVFIHGFNTPFRAASFRAAQLAYDLGFDGPAFLYSWPSVGETLDYVTDLDSASNAALHMDEFLDTVFRIEGVERVHILAHSMGNAALAELLKRAGTRLSARNDKPVDQLVLAAPDLDAGQFRSIADRFTRIANGVTLYAASTDLALLASKSIRRNYERLGDVGENGPLVVPGVDSIDVSAVGTEMLSLNHNIYARNRGVLDDLGRLLMTGARPPTARMPTLRVIETESGPYWQMPQ